MALTTMVESIAAGDPGNVSRWLVVSCSRRATPPARIDYLTIDSPAGEVDWPVHNVLCPAGVVILEVIDLLRHRARSLHAAALPVKLVGSEAAPARAVLLEGVA